MGISPYSEVIVAEVQKGSPADRAGLKRDDKIKSVNGIAVHGPESVPRAVQSSNGKPVVIQVLRMVNKQPVEKTLSIPPYRDDKANRWMIGFIPAEPTVIKKLPLATAFVESIRTCEEHFFITLEFLGKLFQGKLSLKASSGPFDIARMSQDAARTSWTTFLLFIGTISFDIGLINLLPIPALDGGHLFFLVLEGLVRREFSIKVKERVTMVGFAFLICVMVVVLFYDIQRTGPVQDLIERFKQH